MVLTDTAIRSAKPREKPYKMGDSGGLFLLVQPSGGRLWRFKYRVDGREKKLAIGTYPDVTLAEARRKRDEARQQLAEGRDPSMEKRRRQARAAANGVSEWSEGTGAWGRVTERSSSSGAAGSHLGF